MREFFWLLEGIGEKRRQPGGHEDERVEVRKERIKEEQEKEEYTHTHARARLAPSPHARSPAVCVATFQENLCELF